MSAFQKLLGMLGLERRTSRATKKADSTEKLEGAVPLAQDNPRELGHVTFGRDLKEAYTLSKDSGKPIFLLFQEIPGCSTCTNFAAEVLEPQRMVDAISRAFIPVAINNRCLLGHDAKACSDFSEPHLNNPVVRFIDAKGRDLIKRRDGIYRAKDLLPRMEQALLKASRQDLLTHLPSK